MNSMALAVGAGVMSLMGLFVGRTDEVGGCAFIAGACVLLVMHYAVEIGK